MATLLLAAPSGQPVDESRFGVADQEGPVGEADGFPLQFRPDGGPTRAPRPHAETLQASVRGDSEESLEVPRLGMPLGVDAFVARPVGPKRHRPILHAGGKQGQFASLRFQNPSAVRRVMQADSGRVPQGLGRIPVALFRSGLQSDLFQLVGMSLARLEATELRQRQPDASTGPALGPREARELHHVQAGADLPLLASIQNRRRMGASARRFRRKRFAFHDQYAATLPFAEIPGLPPIRG